MSIEEAEQYLKYIFNVLVFISLVAWFSAWQKRQILQGTPVRWLYYMMILLALWAVIEWLLVFVVLKKSFFYFEYIKPILRVLELKEMTLLNPLSYLTKFICLGMFFRGLIKNTTWKTFFQIAIGVLVAFELVQVFIFKSYQQYNSLSSTVKNVFILIGTGVFLTRFYQTDTGTIPLRKNSYFWTSMGLLLPALVEIFLEVLFSTLSKTDLVMFYQLYMLRNITQIIGFLLLIVGIWQAKYLKFLPKAY